SCSLLHSPISLQNETQLDVELRRWLAFADEKLLEVVTLARALGDPESVADSLRDNAAAQMARRNSRRTQNDALRARLSAVSEADTRRQSPFRVRKQAQQSRFNLPLFPTTVIGSFSADQGSPRCSRATKTRRMDPAAIRSVHRVGNPYRSRSARA